jgi:hypothetical protein
MARDCGAPGIESVHDGNICGWRAEFPTGRKWRARNSPSSAAAAIEGVASADGGCWPPARILSTSCSIPPITIWGSVGGTARGAEVAHRGSAATSRRARHGGKEYTRDSRGPEDQVSPAQTSMIRRLRPPPARARALYCNTVNSCFLGKHFATYVARPLPPI